MALADNGIQETIKLLKANSEFLLPVWFSIGKLYLWKSY